MAAIDGELIEDPVLLAQLSAKDQAQVRQARAAGIPTHVLPAGHPAHRLNGRRSGPPIELVAEGDGIKVSKLLVAAGVALFVVETPNAVACATAALPA